MYKEGYMVLIENSLAPDFELPDQDGVLHKLSDYRGKPVVLYFYPKDNTPGCTLEATNFRDDFSKFQQVGGAVVASVKSHFCLERIERYELLFCIDRFAEYIARIV